MKKLSYILVILGASLWGIIGIFVNKLYTLGLSSMEICFLRVASAALLLSIYAIFVDRKSFKIHLKDIFLFIGTGILSIITFNFCYFIAIKETSLSVAAILLYTAPSFVTIFSYFVFKDKISFKKVFSLLLTFLGCVFVTGYFDSATGAISRLGLLAGIGSGIGYSLYSIFGKIALQKYSSLSVTLYSFIFAFIGTLPLISLKRTFVLINNPTGIIYTLCMGLFSTVLAFLFYTRGLENLEPSKASILATVEPVVATITSVLIFKQSISVFQIIGIILVISAIFVVSVQKKENKEIDNIRS